jgi:hypothetical protein
MDGVAKLLVIGAMLLLSGCATPDQGSPPPSVTPTSDLAAPGHPGWSIDPVNGCRVWSREPRAGGTVRWTGDCPQGIASGRGSVEWRWDGPRGPQLSTAAGTFVEGRLEGDAKVLFANGAHYEGEWHDGRPEGAGIFISLKRLRFAGHFRNGIPEGYGELQDESKGNSFRGIWRHGCLDRGNGTFVAIFVSASGYSTRCR